MGDITLTYLEHFYIGKSLEVKGEIEEAIEHYTLAANNGIYKAIRHLSMLYYNGELIDKNVDNAFELFKQIYGNFDNIIKELEELDEEEFEEEDVDIDDEINCYSDCVYLLGEIYESRNNIDEAIKCYKLIIKYNPWNEPLCKLGKLYYESGKYEEAFKYFLEADEDSYFSDFMLGELYFYYYKDYNTALEWYEKAASIGVEEAAFKMGKIHFYGLGGEKNYSEAFACLLFFDLESWQDFEVEDFTYHDFPEALYLLGLMFNDGLGTPKNTVLGKMLLEAAEKAGYKE